MRAQPGAVLLDHANHMDGQGYTLRTYSVPALPPGLRIQATDLELRFTQAVRRVPRSALLEASTTWYGEEPNP